MPSSSSTIDDLAKELHDKVMAEYKKNPDLTYSEILNKFLDEYNDEVLAALGAVIGASIGGSSLMSKYQVSVPQLSSRLYTNSQYVAKETMKVLNTHLDNKSTINEMREALYDGYGYDELLPIKKKLPKYLTSNITEAKISKLKTKSLKASYTDVLLAKNDKALEKAMKVALEEKARYYAFRLADTEEQKAFNNALINEMLSDGVKYVKWTLSQSHSTACVCDYYARYNTGFGEGVYPIDSAPVPVYSTHPFCRCTLRETEVQRYRFGDDPRNTTLDKFNKKDKQKIEYGLDKGWDKVLVRDLV